MKKYNCMECQGRKNKENVEARKNNKICNQAK